MTKSMHFSGALTIWLLTATFTVGYSILYYPKSTGPLAALGHKMARARELYSGAEIAYRSDPFPGIYAIESLEYPFPTFAPATCESCALPLYVFTKPSFATVELINAGVEYEPGMNLPPDRYRIRVSYPGYEARERSIALAHDKHQFIIDLTSP